MKYKQLTQIFLIALSLVIPTVAETKGQSKSNSGRTYARLLWQDQDSQTLHWGDLVKSENWQIEPTELSDAPKLNADRQSLVQMALINEHVVVGVRDHEDGNFQSGWIAIWTGCSEANHGSHSHWYRKSKPIVVSSALDDQQGNPAHVYDYGGVFVLANDKRNGLTLLNPDHLSIAATNSVATKFIECGGNHITAAVIPDSVGYGSWIDRDGDHAGQVDVVGIGENDGKRYSFHLPSAGIHGATVHHDKVFFAPSEDVSWVKLDRNVALTSEKVVVNQIDLGEDHAGNPRRTGAFATFGNWILCTTGRGETAPELCLIDASSDSPTAQRMEIPVAEGGSITTPTCVTVSDGRSFALTVEEHQDNDNPERMHIVQLPTKNDSYAVYKSIKVGSSRISGHSGHHQIVQVSPNYVAVCNPGDGTISIIATKNWTVETTLKVGGVPTHMIARSLN